MIVLSPTNINKFKKCPRRFYAEYVTKEIKWQSNAAMERGTRLHSLMEAGVKEGWDVVAPVWPVDEVKAKPNALAFLAMIDRLKADGWILHAEDACATDGLGNPTDWWGKTGPTWMRSKIDVWAEHPDKDFITVIDWKSGKPWEDEVQLHVNAMCLKPKTQKDKYLIMFAYLDPNKDGIKIKDSWVVVDLTQPAKFDRMANLHSPLIDTMTIIDRMKDAYATDKFPAKSNIFCGNCEIQQTCNPKDREVGDDSYRKRK